MNDPFQSGFVKRAEQYGIPAHKALNLYKQAISKEEEDEINGSNFHKKDSSIFGRWADTKAQRSQAYIEHPFKGYAGKSIGGILGALGGGGMGAGIGAGIGALGAKFTGGDPSEAMRHGAEAGGIIGGVPGAYVGHNFGGSVGSQGFSQKKRQETLGDADDKLRHRSTLGNIGHSALNLGTLGAVTGGIFGALKGNQGLEPGSEMSDDYIKGILENGLLGAGLGGAGGAVYGGVRGGINSLIHKETSDETHKRTNNLLAKHPFGTSMPLGDIVGSSDS